MKNECRGNVDKYGLLGRNIAYSFSRSYFSGKFEKEGINAVYQNFDIPEIGELQQVLQKNPELRGFNVTIPYKEQILSFLDDLDPVAEEISAVNTVKIQPDGTLKGFNTDYFGFSEAIRPMLKPYHQKALILGTGGASKAISYALHSLGIAPVYVSRNPKDSQYSYKELDQKLMEDHLVIINCTPLGTSPQTLEFPPIPIDFITADHLVFDLIYNPGVTKLMEIAKSKGATVSNGLRMLELQAEKSWEHWH